MFETGISMNVTARHTLHDMMGPEAEDHSHEYRIEWTCRCSRLDEHGFSVDISLLSEILADELSHIGGRSLNALEFFHDRQPSLEYFAVYLFRRFRERLLASGAQQYPERMRIRINEDADAWASFEGDFTE